jgi:hypothetical protein
VLITEVWDTTHPECPFVAVTYNPHNWLVPARDISPRILREIEMMKEEFEQHGLPVIVEPKSTAQ